MFFNDYSGTKKILKFLGVQANHDDEYDLFGAGLELPGFNDDSDDVEGHYKIEDMLFDECWGWLMCVVRQIKYVAVWDREPVTSALRGAPNLRETYLNILEVIDDFYKNKEKHEGLPNK